MAAPRAPDSTLRRRVARWALVVFAVAAAFVALEVGYRFVLWNRTDVTTDNQRALYAVSESVYAFDRDLGYAYVPGVESVSLRVHDGRVADVWPCVINRDGNIGDPEIATGWQGARNRILVAGDSFTANPNFGGVAWPDDLHAALRGQGISIAVRNFGRDGYGILQMLTMAAVQSERHDPNIVVLAFIVDDLTRDRFWRVTIDGDYRRIFSTTEPLADPEPHARAELALVNPSIAGLKPGDEASYLSEQYLKLASPLFEIYRAALLSPGHSVVVSRLLQGDPLAGVTPAARNPRHALERFSDDPQFAREAAALRARSVPVVLVQIPTCQEIEAGAYDIDDRSRALLANLRESLLGADFVDLMAHIEIPAEGVRAGVLYPRNGHPGPKGSRMFGAALARVLMARGVVARE